MVAGGPELNPIACDLGMIDVPGHEDFVKNMVTGVGSIDYALLVIAGMTAGCRKRRNISNPPLPEGPPHHPHHHQGHRADDVARWSP